MRSTPSTLGAAFALSTLLVALAVDAHAEECGNALDSESAAALEAQFQAGAYRLDPRGQSWRFANKTLLVPVTVHIVRQSNGTGGLPDTSADNSIAIANSYYSAAGIQFFRQGAIHYLDNDAFYSSIDTRAEIDALRQTDVVANTINLYFTMNLADQNGSLCGYSSYTTDAVQGIALANGCTTSGGNLSTVAHELGHYFDLLHTHETQFGTECPDGSNCATAGDRICDTPASPNLDRPGWESGSCAYLGDTTVCNGQAYSPDTRNLMAYGIKNCRDHFSGQQIEKILATLVNLRPNLVSAGLNSVTWVDFGYVGTEDGTYARPYHSFAWAATHTASGGTVIVRAGSTHETLLVNAYGIAVDTFRGPATLGAP